MILFQLWSSVCCLLTPLLQRFRNYKDHLMITQHWTSRFLPSFWLDGYGRDWPDGRSPNLGRCVVPNKLWTFWWPLTKIDRLNDQNALRECSSLRTPALVFEWPVITLVLLFSSLSSMRSTIDPSTFFYDLAILHLHSSSNFRKSRFIIHSKRLRITKRWEGIADSLVLKNLLTDWWFSSHGHQLS